MFSPPSPSWFPKTSGRPGPARHTKLRRISMLPLLITGGCGFIGSNFIRYLLEVDANTPIVNLDLLTYAGNHGNLKDFAGHPRYRFVRGDIADATIVRQVVGSGVSAIINFA